MTSSKRSLQQMMTSTAVVGQPRHEACKPMGTIAEDSTTMAAYLNDAAVRHYESSRLVDAERLYLEALHVLKSSMEADQNRQEGFGGYGGMLPVIGRQQKRGERGNRSLYSNWKLRTIRVATAIVGSCGGKNLSDVHRLLSEKVAIQQQQAAGGCCITQPFLSSAVRQRGEKNDDGVLALVLFNLGLLKLSIGGEQGHQAALQILKLAKNVLSPYVLARTGEGMFTGTLYASVQFHLGLVHMLGEDNDGIDAEDEDAMSCFREAIRSILAGKKGQDECLLSFATVLSGVASTYLQRHSIASAIELFDACSAIHNKQVISIESVAEEHEDTFPDLAPAA